MKIKYIAKLLFILLIIACFDKAEAQTMSDDTLLVPKTTVAPVIDGELDDVWYNVTRTRNLTYVTGTEPAEWTDSFFWYRVMWDDQYFYLFIDVFDDELNTNNGNVWERDGFEIYFDGDNSKNSQQQGYDENDNHFRWVYGESSGNPGPASAVHAFKDTDHGYNFELAIPINELAFDFEAEHVFGFDLQYNDNDGNSRQHITKWWSSSDNNYLDPSLFGTAKLVGRQVSNYLDVNKIDQSPSIDGESDEVWEYLPEISNNKYVLLNGTNYNNFQDWDDLVYSYKAAWDDENFYFFIKVFDNEKNTSSSNGWENDGIEIYFDGDNSKNDINTGYDGNDYHFSWVYNDYSSSSGAPNNEFAWQSTEEGYNFELKIPVAGSELSLEEDYIFGFEVQVNDNDQGVRNKIGKWRSESDNSYLDPSLFGTAILTSYENPAILEPAEKPEFSVERGFYENSFDVEVSSETPGAIIKYTFDGSDPRNSTNVLQSTSPVSIHIDPESTVGQRGQTPGFVLRACAEAPEHKPSETITNTYLFINKIVQLSPHNTKPGQNWPEPTNSANPQAMNYGMDPEIVYDPSYQNLIDDAMLAIPSISLTTNLNNLFSQSTGIYMNALQEGRNWERPASIELINPDGSNGFQINAGMRIRGGWSSHGDNPKHAFRLFFRNEYGEGKLDFPLFEDEGVDEFDKVDIRTSQNYSWSYPGHAGDYNTMNRDVFSRDLQREMGQPYTRSRYYHLYVNGVYWGLFQSQERAEANFAESYLGGSDEDYDVIKPGGSGIEATDGNLDAYREVWNMTSAGFQSDANYFKLQGLNPDGTTNSSYKNLVDVDNLIDFMLIIFYAGNYDSPVSKFGQNNGLNNFFCIYNRNGKDGFKFFIHDAEHTLRTTSGEGPGIGLYENRVNIGSISGNYRMRVSSFNMFHPQWLHFKLSDNEEYRIRFADHVYKYFFNNGCMTPEKAADLFISRAHEIETAIIAESARWGDTYYNPPKTQADWQWAVDDIMDNYFPYRTNIVLNQLKDEDLYPDIDPPVFNGNNQEIITETIEVEPGYKLKIQNPNGTQGAIQYTLDNKDPRIIGGNTSSSAIDGGDETELTINSTTIINARILDGSTWSALHKIILFVGSNEADLKVTEIHYHPMDNGTISGNKYEFIELKNIGSAPLNLSQAFFEDGITYTFPDATILNPGKFIVLASDRQEFNNRYGFFPFGTYLGQLDNSGEEIVLCDASEDTIVSFSYDDHAPWPELPDGEGYSLVTTEFNPTGDLNDPSNWRASYDIHGSPGRDDDASTEVEAPSEELPASYELKQNYPNPFNPETRINYALKNSGKVKLVVYDILGREIAVLVNEDQKAGNYEVIFSAYNHLASGIYFYRLQTKEFVLTKKMILLR